MQKKMTVIFTKPQITGITFSNSFYLAQTKNVFISYKYNSNENTMFALNFK